MTLVRAILQRCNLCLTPFAANTAPGDLLVYDIPISHISRFHLTFSCPATSWNEWFIELKALLSKPYAPCFVSKTNRHRWFFGTLSTAEAASLLAQQPVGTFLIRFSAPPGALAIGAVTPGGVVKHFKILHEPGKNYVIGDTTECLTLDEVLGLADRMCHCKVPLSSVPCFCFSAAVTNGFFRSHASFVNGLLRPRLSPRLR